jgi:cobalt-zinc-cadmium efflux system membrane fusion protein
MGNRDGHWHPGCFVTAEIRTGETEVPVLVPRSALVRLDNGAVQAVFVEDEHGFEPRPVVVAGSAAGWVAIESGLADGERYVAEGAFALAAELAKGGFGHGHAH